MIMFFQDARAYILKLIRIQKKLIKKGYVRNDQSTVIEAIAYLKRYLAYYKFDTDDQMRGFFERNHDRIRTLIPNESYPGFKKLMNEYLTLQNQ